MTSPAIERGHADAPPIIETESVHLTVFLLFFDRL
jgi:hypothetical protein